MSIESGIFVTCSMQYAMSMSTVYIYILCVLMALGMFMFVKVMSSLISVMRPHPLLVCSLCLCVWWGSGVFLVF